MKKNTCGTCKKFKTADCPHGDSKYMEKSNPACSQHPNGKYVKEDDTPEVLPPVNKALTQSGNNAIQTSHTPGDVTAQYRRAISGTLEMLRFGAMLVEIDSDLRKETRGNQYQQGNGGLQKWLTENCPDVNYKTAMRFKHLADNLQREFNIPAKVSLTAALPAADGSTMVPEAVPESKRGKVVDIQAEIWEFVQGKSARQLLFDFGMAERKATGGDHRSGISMSETEKHQKHVDMVKKQYVIYTHKLYDMTRGLKEHLLLDADTLAGVLLQLDTIREHLRAAQGKRK